MGSGIDTVWTCHSTYSLILVQQLLDSPLPQNRPAAKYSLCSALDESILVL